MNFLLDERTFKIFFIAWLLLTLCLAYTMRYFLKKRGVNIDSGRNLLKLVLWILPIAFIPFWLDPKATLKNKVIGTIIGLLVGIANYYAVDRGGKVIRQFLGIEDAEDIRERIEKENKRSKGR